jgi:AbiV family abortive infection protein
VYLRLERSTLSGYRGKLSFQQIAAGISACLENATALVDDARLLADAGRPPRALFNLLAADQELGKIGLLTAMARIHPSRQSDWAPLWRDFQRHERKAVHALVDALPDESRTVDAFFLALAGLPESAQFAERLRQASLYVDFSADKKNWRTPLQLTAAVVTQKLGDTLQALSRHQTLHALGFYSAQSLRIQHEELAQAQRDILSKDHLTLADARQAVHELIPRFRRFFRRLVDEGAVDAFPPGFTLMGLPWEEFVYAQQED